MITYDFYKNTYLGTKIEETAFPQAVARAEDYVAFLERQYRVIPAGPAGRQMAVCAVMEELQEAKSCMNISSAAVGNVSIAYKDQAPLKQVFQAVMPYLQIRRGVD